MSKLRSINTAIWNDVWFEELNTEHKLLFIYLITNEKTNMLGVYEISKRKISFDTGIDSESIAKGFEWFEKSGKILYKCDCVILLNYLRHQNYNFNMKKSAIDCYNSLKEPLKIENQPIIDRTEKGFETLCKGFGMVRKIEVELEVEYELEKEVKKENTNEIKNFDSVSKPTKKQLIEKFKEDLLLNGADEKDLDDWISIRKEKKAQFSERALNTFLNECKENNYPVYKAVKICADNGWSGFKFEWTKSKNNGKQQNNESDPKIGRTRLSALEKLREQMLNQ